MKVKFLAALALAIAALVGCSGADFDSPTSQPAQVVESSATMRPSLVTTANADRRKVVEPVNLIVDLSGPWPNWAGEATGIADNGAGALFIPGDETLTEGAVQGVKQYEIPLVEGAEYTLSHDGPAETRSLIFAYRKVSEGVNEFVSLGPDVFDYATPGTPFVFTAPAGIVGFYIQVQNVWDSPEIAAIVTPGLSPEGAPPPVEGNLLALGEDWYTNFALDVIQPGVLVNGVTGNIELPPPLPGPDYDFISAVQLQPVMLEGGATYMLSIQCNFAWCGARVDVGGANHTAFSNTGLEMFPEVVEFTVPEDAADFFLSVSSFNEGAEIGVSLVKLDVVPAPVIELLAITGITALDDFLITAAEIADNEGEINIDVGTDSPETPISVTWGPFSESGLTDEDGNLFITVPEEGWPEGAFAVTVEVGEEGNTSVLTTEPIAIGEPDPAMVVLTDVQVTGVDESIFDYLIEQSELEPLPEDVEIVAAGVIKVTGITDPGARILLYWGESIFGVETIADEGGLFEFTVFPEEAPTIIQPLLVWAVKAEDDDTDKLPTAKVFPGVAYVPEPEPAS